VRFLRHLAAVVLVVGVVVLGGLAWEHLGASTLIGTEQVQFRQEIVTGPLATRRLPPGVKLPPGTRVNGGPDGRGAGAMSLGLGSMFDPVNLPVLRHTVVIEAVVIAAVVLLDLSRRASRRARREQLLAAGEAESARDEG
jgi:hypothetical protein